MFRILLSISSMIAACAPWPQKVAMPNPSPFFETSVPGSIEPNAGGAGSATPDLGGDGVGKAQHAASAPIAKGTVANKAASNPLADSPAEALGRRILSTAFVRVGADGHLTIELRNGRVMVLRDVVMRRNDYCGVQATRASSRARYCGGYAEVAAARPGGEAPPASRT